MLPAPQPNESERDFIARCMGHEKMLAEFPDEAQRSAVCYRQWREATAGRAAADSAPILARVPFALAADGTAPEWIMWMPGGEHTITGTRGGRRVTLRVRIGPEDAARVQASLQEHLRGRQRPYFDFDHDGKAASAWPLEFAWHDMPEPGIWARVEWSDAGRAAVVGKTYRAFSPKWFPTDTDPAGVAGAPLNMGGLVNDPAFEQIAPLWGKAPNHQQSTVNPQPSTGMTNNTELAALQARIAELETAKADLEAKLANDETKAALEAAKQEQEQLRAELSRLKDDLEARKRRDAEACVASAVARGAIAPKDEATQKKWRDLILSDPANAELLAKLPGKPAVSAGRITPSAIRVLKTDVADALRGYVTAANPRERGEVYQKEFKPLLDKGERIPFERAPVEAANVLGTLAGNIIAQRTLDLIVSRRPMLLNVTTDFSDQQAVKGQTIYTRTVGIPSVADFGSAASDTAMTDYSVALDQHKQVYYAFGAAEYLATNRNLVEEVAPALAASIGNALVDAVAALITPAFTSAITGPAANKDFSALTSAAKTLNTNGAPDFARSMWVNADFAEALSNDELIMEYLDGNNRTAYGHWLNIKGFDNVWEYPALPTTSNLIGFAFQRSALILAARVADNPERLVGAGYPGTLQVVTDPISGLSVLTDRWIEQGTRKVNTRIDVLYGCARGVLTCGVRFVSA
ncbi:MAG: hypothetical protein N3I86_06625 [Verrucomicrobiae bacterium]|nr:hypothetical protein [Verrucomicrobiae bacterium]